MATVDPKVLIDDLIKKTISNDKFEIQIKNPHSLVSRLVAAAKKADAIQQITLQQNVIIATLVRQLHILKKLAGADRSDAFAREDYRLHGEEAARAAEAQEKQIEKIREKNAKAQESFKELQEKHDVAKKELDAVQHNIQNIAERYSIAQANLEAIYTAALLALPAQVLKARRIQFQEEINSRFEQLDKQRVQLTTELTLIVNDLVVQQHQANVAYLDQAGANFAQQHNVGAASAQQMFASLSSIAEQKFSEQEYRDARIAAGSPKVFGRPEIVFLKQKECIREFCEKNNIFYSEQLANEIINQRQQQLNTAAVVAVQQKVDALKEDIRNVNEEELGASINNLFESAEFEYQASDPTNRVDCRAEEQQLKAAHAEKKQRLDVEYGNELRVEEQKLPGLQKKINEVGVQLEQQKTAIQAMNTEAGKTQPTQQESASAAPSPYGRPGETPRYDKKPLIG